MKREKFLCPGCHVLDYRKRHGVCTRCGRVLRELSKIHTEIVRRHPELKEESLSMIVLRLWIAVKKAEPETVRRARALFEDASVSRVEEPEQGELF